MSRRRSICRNSLVIFVLAAASALALWDLQLLRAIFLPGNFRLTLHFLELFLFLLLVVDLGVRFFLGHRPDLVLLPTAPGAKSRRVRVRSRRIFGSMPGRNGIPLPGPQVSRQHLEVRITAVGKLFGRDLGSTNGTFRHREDGAEEDLRSSPDGVELLPGDQLELGRGGPRLRCAERPGARAVSDPVRRLAWLLFVWSGLFAGLTANREKLPKEAITLGQVVLDFGIFLELGPLLAVGAVTSLAGLLWLRSERAPEAGMAVLLLLALGLSALYPLLPAVALRYAEAAERAFHSVEKAAGAGAWSQLELWEKQGEEAAPDWAPHLDAAERTRLLKRYEQGRAALRWAVNLAGRDGRPFFAATYFRQALVLALLVLLLFGASLLFAPAQHGARAIVEALRQPISERLIRAADHGAPIARLLRPVAYWDVACGFLAAMVVAAALWSPFGASLGRGKSLFLDLPGIPTVQSVELVKALFVLFVTGYFARQGTLIARVARRRYVLPYILATLLTLALTGVQADMGGLFMLGLFLGFVFVAATGHMRLVLGVPLLLLPGLALATALGLTSVVSTRIEIWLSPRLHPLGEQLVEARQLLLSSGWFGFPAHRQLASQVADIQGDLVFAALAERFGGAGLLALAGCWLILIGSLLREARRAGPGISILRASVAALLLVQVLTQAGGIMGLLPLTGVPLPWLSHGLTASLIFTGLTALALVARDREGAQGARAAGALGSDPLRFLDRANVAFFLVVTALVIFWTVALPVRPEIGHRGRLYLAQDSGRANRFADRRAPAGALATRDGVVVARSPRGGDRRYPLGESFFHPVGYQGALASPLGIEGAARSFLRGQSLGGPHRRIAFKADLHHGPDLVLTLAAEVQRSAYAELAGRPGAAVVLDLNDGSLLALASSPGVDAESAGLDTWRRLAADPGAPLRPRALRSTDVYSPPGSVFKIVVAAAILESATLSPRETTRCTGRDPRLRVSCAHGAAHGAVDLHRALVVSCNIYFARAVVRLGPAAIRQISERFGFNEKEGPDLLRGVPYAELRPQASTVDVPMAIRERDLARVGYGQGPVSATPLQIARMGAVIARGGALLDPVLVRELALVSRPRTGAPRTVWRERLAEGKWRRAIAGEHAAALRAPLVEVFDVGTARRLDRLWRHPDRRWLLAKRQPREPGWQRVLVAGKTGSAWKTRLDRTDDAWMVAWAPAESPRVVVSVWLEDAGEGGKVAGPIAMRLLRDALVALGEGRS